MLEAKFFWWVISKFSCQFIYEYGDSFKYQYIIIHDTAYPKAVDHAITESGYYQFKKCEWPAAKRW